jgi:TPR repeat protein
VSFSWRPATQADISEVLRLVRALAEYERGSKAGQVDCMVRAANFYLAGRGIEKDADRGLEMLAKAAEAGQPVAHFQLAAHHLSGEKPDLGLGYNHLLAAASGNLADAQNELGLFYLAGKLGSSDAAAAVAWLTRAAQNGSVAAQNNLATLFESGSGGMARDLESAGKLYALAANQGHGPATLALARLLSQNSGIQPNLVKAWALATLASERGETTAAKLADDISAKLSVQQMVDAKRELATIKSGKPTAPAPDEAKESKESKKSK